MLALEVCANDIIIVVFMAEIRVRIRACHINWVIQITIISESVMGVLTGPEWLVLILIEVIVIFLIIEIIHMMVVLW